MYKAVFAFSAAIATCLPEHCHTDPQPAPTMSACARVSGECSDVAAWCEENPCPSGFEPMFTHDAGATPAQCLRGPEVCGAATRTFCCSNEPIKTCAVDGDCPSPANTCLLAVCDQGLCRLADQNNTQPCGDGGTCWLGTCN